MDFRDTKSDHSFPYSADLWVSHFYLVAASSGGERGEGPKRAEEVEGGERVPPSALITAPKGIIHFEGVESLTLAPGASPPRDAGGGRGYKSVNFYGPFELI